MEVCRSLAWVSKSGQTFFSNVLNDQLADSTLAHDLSSKIDEKKWNRFVPFTKAWSARRKAQKGVIIPPEIGNVPTASSANKEAKTEADVSNATQTEPEPKPQVITATATNSIGQDEIRKTLTVAQYPHHDDKFAAGRIAPEPRYQSYPYKSHIGGERVLASYGHVSDKWAASC